MGNHELFVVWMICYPLAESIGRYFDYKARPEKKYSDGAYAFSAVVNLIIWFGIGFGILRWG